MNNYSFFLSSLNKISNKKFVVLIVGIYTVLNAIGSFYHEMWIDEAYHYLISIHTNGFIDLFRNEEIKNSGQPNLWYLTLFYSNVLFKGMLGAKVLHCILAVFSIYLLTKYSRLHRIQIIFIVFGYYFFYEYSIITKNYIIGISLLLLSIVCFQQKKSIYFIALILFLAANCHLFILIVAFFLMIYFLVEKKEESKWILPFFIVLLGCTLSIIQIVPNHNRLSEFQNYDSSSYFSLGRLIKAINVIGKGLLNIPDYRILNMWNSNVFFNFNSLIIITLSLAMSALSYLMLKKDKIITLLFFLPLLAIMLVIYITPYSVGVRYWGFSYLLLIIITWLYKLKHKQNIAYNSIFTIILFIQFIVGIISYIIDVKRPFSNAKQAVDFISQSPYKLLDVYHEDLATGPSYSAYSGNPIFYPYTGTFETYRFALATIYLDKTTFLNECKINMIKQNKSEVVLVSNKNIENYIIPNNLSLKHLTHYDNAIVRSENYYLYLLSIKNNP